MSFLWNRSLLILSTPGWCFGRNVVALSCQYSGEASASASSSNRSSQPVSLTCGIISLLCFILYRAHVATRDPTPQRKRRPPQSPSQAHSHPPQKGPSQAQEPLEGEVRVQGEVSSCQPGEGYFGTAGRIIKTSIRINWLPQGSSLKRD